MARNQQWDPRAALAFINNVVQFDPGSGKYRTTHTWSPAYSGRNQAARVRRTKEMHRALEEFRAANAAKGMARAGVKGYRPSVGDDGEYEFPNSGDPDWDLDRVKADYLNFQVQNQGRSIEEAAKTLGKREPSGWRGVLHDALDNPGGDLLMRGLDVISRPAYGVAEGYDAILAQARGETPEQMGWEKIDYDPDPSRYAVDMRTGKRKSDKEIRGGKGWFRNTKTGEIVYQPEWDDPDEGFFKNVAKGVGRGLSGKDKTSFGDVLRGRDVIDGKPAAVAGLGLDIALDPTSYVTFGTSTLARTGTKEAVEAGTREALEASAKATAREMLETGAVKGPMAERRAFSKALKAEMELAGVSRRPTRQVLHDINSSHSATSVERTLKDTVTKALDDPFWKPKTQRAISRSARNQYKAIQKVLGETVDPAELKKVGLQAMKEARDEFSSKVGADVMDAIATRKALRENISLDVRVGGKTVARSRTLGKGIAAASKAARGTRVGGTLAKTFRTDAQIGEALHRTQRQHYNVSAAQFEAEAKQVKKTFTDLGLSKKQRQAVARAVESNDTKGFTAEMVEGYEAAKKFFQGAFDREVEAGALSATDFKQDYLYHVYKEPDFSRGLGSWVKPTGRGSQKFQTLAQAEAAGARPLTDIADILVYRLAKSHRVAASHLMMRDIATRFGVSKTAGKKVSNKMFDKLEADGLLVEGRKIGGGAGRFFAPGTYFDQDVAASLAKMEQIFSNDQMITRFGRLFDQFQARMKFLQTAPNPGFHIRNTMSDMFINFLDGVTSIVPYRQAATLVRGKNAKQIKITLKNGLELDGNEIIQQYDGMGLRAGFFHAEAGIIPGMGSKLTHGTNNVIRKFSEVREDTMRMAHFIDALKKTPKTDTIEEAAELAAKRVRKYNFDYQDLTNVEKKIFRRAVPFYTFMRKNVPLMMETYMTRPGRMIVPTKAQNALAAFLGNDNRDEPLPGMISSTPEWIARIPGAEVVTGGPEQDPVFMQPDMPYGQIDQLFGGFAQGGNIGDNLENGVRGFLKELLLESSTPLIRGPAEYATQTDLATGADQPQTPFDAIINQLPVGRIAQPHLADIAPESMFKGTDRPGSPTFDVGGVDVPENILNYLTGMGFRKVTPQRQASELRRRQDILEAIIKQMKEASEKNAQDEWDATYGERFGT